MARKASYQELEYMLRGLEQLLSEQKNTNHTLKKQIQKLRHRIRELNCLYSISRLLERRYVSSEDILQKIVMLMPHAWQHPKKISARITLKEREYRSRNFSEISRCARNDKGEEQNDKGEEQNDKGEGGPQNGTAVCHPERSEGSLNDNSEFPLKQSAAVIVSGRQIGKVEVFFSEQTAEQEESRLIRIVAEHIGRFTDERETEDLLKKYQDSLELQLIEANDELKHEIETRRHAEKSLRESEEKHRIVLEAAPDPVAVYDIEGKIVYLNPAFTRVFGWTSEESIGRYNILL